MDLVQIGDTIIPRRNIKSDNAQWKSRFEFTSVSSGKKYIIAQRKTTEEWSCSCWQWRKKRTCKHLKELGLVNSRDPVRGI
jgi:hypothetical protein